jgi:hypothetical protein
MQNEIKIQSLDAAASVRWYDVKRGTLHDDAGKLLGVLAAGDERVIKMAGDLAPEDVQAGFDTALAQRNEQAEGVADVVCPVIDVQRELGSYFTEDPADATHQVLPQAVAFGGATPHIDPRLASAQFTTAPLGLAAITPAEVGGNSDFDLAAMKLDRIIAAHELARESRVVTLLTTAASYAAATQKTLDAAHAWNGGASSDPIGDLTAMLAGSALPITHIALGERAAIEFFKDSRVAAFFQALNQAGARDTFPKIVVGKRRQTATGANAYIHEADCILVRSPGDKNKLHTAVTLRWDMAKEAAPGEQLTKVRGYPVREFVDAGLGPRGSRSIVVLAPDAEVFTGLDSSSKCVVGAVIKGVFQ